MPDHSLDPPAPPMSTSGDVDGEARRAMMGLTMTGGPERSPFGTALRQARLTAGLSQERLAERAGLSARTLSDLERGVATQPRLETVQLLATALALPAVERAALLAAARPAPPWAPTPQAPPALYAALTPLIGRAHERALLTHVLTGTGPIAESTPPLLLLAGEPGIGKTRLLQAAAQEAIGRGWTVLEGGCYRRGGQAPFAPLLDALAHYLHVQRPAHLEAALKGCAWLGRLLPELAPLLEPLPVSALPPEQERRLVYSAVARLLANVAGPDGTLLVLDDLQWAGPDALDLLAALLRRPELRAGAGGAGRARLRVVGAYRDTEVQPADPLGLLAADLAQAGLVRYHALGPLASAEATELLASLLGGATAGADEGTTRARVLERAGGTPFYLVSYAQALGASRVDGGAGAEAVPWDVAQGVRQRVALLPEAARELLGVAAVVGRRVPWALLVASCGQGEDTVLAGLEAAGRARLLVEAGDDVYAFAHDVIREVVEADLSAARRRVVHHRVAEALEAQPGEPAVEALAFHYDRGGSPERAVGYLEMAGDQALVQRAHAAAEDHYRAALERGGALGHALEAARVREKLGEVVLRTGRYDAALRDLEPAAAMYRAAGDRAGLARITARLAWAHYLRGTPWDGRALIESLLGAQHPDEVSSERAALYAVLARLFSVGGEYAASLTASERAAALARAAGDDRTLVQAESERMNTLQTIGRIGEALRVSQELLPLAEAAGDLDSLLRAYRDLAYISTLRGAFAAGRAALARALPVAEQIGDPADIAFTLTLCGWISFLSGDWSGARADLERGVALSQQLERSGFAPYTLLFQEQLWLAIGDEDAADAAVGTAFAMAKGTVDLQAQRWAAAVAAERDILAGRPEAAHARLAPLLDRPGLEECDVTALLPLLAWAHLEQGHLEEATATVRQALRRARIEEMRLVLVEALRVQALIALRQERRLDRGGPRAAGRESLWEAAAHGLEEGLALARELSYPYAEARLLHASAQLHHQRSELEPARSRLEAALAIFQRLGARQDAARVAQALASLSQNPAPSQNGPMATFEPQITEAQWTRVAAILPSRARTGRPRADDRLVLEAILYKQRTGCAWAALPAELGDGATAHRRWRQWQEAGLWHQIAAIAQAPLAPMDG